MLAISQRHIEVFRAVMSSGGVTAAANALNSSQPTVSRALARMERLLGYALFARQRGRLIPSARHKPCLTKYSEPMLALAICSGLRPA